MYSRIVFITNIKYIPLVVLVELARLYKEVCVVYFKSTGGIKTAVDTAYINNGYMIPAPLYIYTSYELRTQAKRNLTMYCNKLGVDICFKVHV